MSRVIVIAYYTREEILVNRQLGYRFVCPLYASNVIILKYNVSRRDVSKV